MIKTLIVEDEFLVRMGLKTTINWAEYGFQIIGEATNGEEGLDMYLKHRPSLVITDIKMPKMDGITLMTAIRKLNKDVHFIVLTAFADFSYAQSAIKLQVDGYLLKGTMINEELTSLLEKVAAAIPQKTAIPSENSALPSMKALLAEEPPVMKVCPFCQNEEDTLRAACLRITGQKNPVINDSFRNLCLNALSEKQLEYKAFAEGDRLYLLMNSSQNHSAIMGLLSDTIQRYLGRQIFCGISLPAKGSEHINPYISQAKNACDSNILDPEKGWFRIYSQPSFSRSDKVDNLLLSLNQALLARSARKCVQILEELESELVTAGSTKLLNRSLYHIVIILSQYDESLNETELLRSLLDLDELNLIFQETARRFTDMCEALSRLMPRNDHYIESAKLFIRNNMSENIKLRDIAEYLHLSPNYLGKLFFLGTGTHLTDFIISEKIQTACRLIQETDLLIGEIAQQVGLNDAQYFSKLFKKKTGHTPKEYTRIYKK